MQRNRLFYWGVSGLTLALLLLLQLALGSGSRPVSVAPGQNAVPLFEQYLAAHEGEGEAEETGEGGAAAMRGMFEYWQMFLQNEKHEIPPDALTKALGQIAMMRQAQSRVSAKGADLSRTAWAWLGPANIGGRVNTIAFLPSDASKVWVGTAGGGIWKSQNAGASWAVVDDFLANLSVTSLVINPATPTTMYAGTGEAYSGGQTRGAGVFKSTDGGVIWTQLASTTGTDWYFVRRLAISPDGATLLAATSMYYSNVPAGIWRSTDGGTTWTQTFLLPNGNSMDDVKFHPTDSSQAVAGSHEGGIWRTADGGVTWQGGTYTGAGRIELAYAPSNPLIVYANVDKTKGQLWKSTDGGANWASVNTTAQYLGTQGWIHTAVWVDPTNANTVVVGGLDLWRSTNGGATLTKISRWQAGPPSGSTSAHADQKVIVSPPGYNGTSNKLLYVGNDGGVFRTQDVLAVQEEAGWENLNTNLGVTQFYGFAVNSANVVVGGTQDNGTLRFNGDPMRWTPMFGGDGGYAAADPADPKYLYGEYTNLTIHRSGNGGDWQAEDIYGEYWKYDATNGWQKATTTSPIADAGKNTANFIAPFILDPNNSNRMYGGGQSLWRTNNVKNAMGAGGPDWLAVKAATPGNNITAMAVAPGNADRVWVGHRGGEVFLTTNGTDASPTWNQMGGGTLPARAVTRIVVDPANANTVYVTFGGFSPDNIWRSPDNGGNWTSFTGTGVKLPEIPVYDLKINPTNANWFYAATELGVFTSEDGGANWAAMNDGPANVRVTELVLQSNTLYAGTFGRGIYKAALTGVTPTCYTLSLAALPAANGEALQTPPPNCNTKYTAGTVVQVQATPKAGFGFVSWSGDASGVAGKISVTMDGDKSITANFSAVTVCYTLGVSVAPNEGGAVTQTPAADCNNGTQYTAGTTIYLTGTANPGYAFGGWSGAAVGNDPNRSVMLDSDKTITATFATPAPNDGIGAAITVGGSFKLFLPLIIKGSPTTNAQSGGGWFTSHRPRPAAVAVVYDGFIDTTNSTGTAGDPLTCEAGAGTHSVWYIYNATANGLLTLDTTGSNYDTTLMVFSGTVNNLVALECDDDTEDDGASYDDYDPLSEEEFYDPETDDIAQDQFAKLTITVQTGVTYYIYIADATEPGVFAEDNPPDETDFVAQGGLLHLRVTFDPVN